MGVRALNASGIAQMTTLTLPAGTHFLRAVYGGGIGGYQPSQSAPLPYIVTALSGAGFAVQMNYGHQ